MKDIKKIRLRLKKLGVNDKDLSDEQLKQMLSDYEFVKQFYRRKK